MKPKRRSESEIERLHAEGEEVMKLLDMSTDAVDDELTRGRIRAIYAQAKYGQKPTIDIADYYNLPVQLIKDIRDGRAFAHITVGGE